MLLNPNIRLNNYLSYRTTFYDALKNDDIYFASQIIEKMDAREIAFAIYENGCSPLHLVAKKGFNGLIAKLLNKCGADLIKKVDISGRTALYYAVKSSDYQSVRCLLDQMSNEDILRQYDENFFSVLHLAVRIKNTCIASTLMTRNRDLANKIDANGLTPLHWAVIKRDLPTLFALVQLTPAEDLCIRDEIHLSTVLHVTVIHITNLNEQIPILNCLLHKGEAALAGIEDQKKQTALHWAVKKNNFEVCRVLCNFMHYPDIHKVDKYFQSALDLSQDKDSRIIELLIQKQRFKLSDLDLKQPVSSTQF